MNIKETVKWAKNGMDISGAVDVRDILHYSDIIKDKEFVAKDGCHRILILKYENFIWYAHMHNGETIDLTKLAYYRSKA